MASDEDFLALLAEALNGVRLDAIVVGNTASILNGAAVLTQDVDLLVRDTSGNRRKLQQLAALIGGVGPTPVSELSRVERIYGAAVPVDILFDQISGRLSFATIRSRAHNEHLGASTLLVASLADVIASKRAAGRPKDRAALPALEDALLVRKKLGLP